jgi:hypothetical protein
MAVLPLFVNTVSDRLSAFSTAFLRLPELLLGDNISGPQAHLG